MSNWKITPLEEILKYKNPHVLDNFIKFHPHLNVPVEKAPIIFEDLIRYLWLSATISEKAEKNPEWDAPTITISHSMTVIDQMWHTFVLFTEFYADFCQKYFGNFVHHPPPAKKWIANTKKLGAEEAGKIMVDELLACIMEYLGPEVTIRWFEEYEQYMPSNTDDLIAHH